MPNPEDPSALTREMLHHEIQHLQDLFETSIRHSSELSEASINHLKDSIAQSLVEKDLRDGQRFDAQSKALDAARVSADLAVQAALVAAEKAVSKAEIAAEKRFDTVSEKVDDAKTFTNDAISGINSQIAAITGKSIGSAATVAYLIAGVSVLITIALFVIKVGGG